MQFLFNDQAFKFETLAQPDSRSTAARILVKFS